MKKKLSVLLSAALLLSALTACHGPAAGSQDPAGSRPSSGSSSQGVLPGGSSGTGDTSQPLPEPEPEPPVEYDPLHTLGIKYPRVSPGALELPVRGATGYASVQLPLWEEIPESEPEEPEPPVEPEPENPAEPGPADPQQPGDSSGEQAPEGAGSSPAPGDSSIQPPVGDSAAPAQGDTSTQAPNSSSQIPGDSTVSDSGLTPAPSSPFLPGFLQDPEGEGPHEPTIGPDGEIIYAPGEEPLPEPEPEPDIDPFEGALAVLEPGTAFTILEEGGEEGAWWLVESKDGTGWIENRYCLINLPDVIPSMVYNATNSYDSRFVTLGRDIPGITGRSFYPRGSYNRRLERNEFMMPVLYSMSKRICRAQQAALAQGNTLVLYEGYRPQEVQTKVYRALTELSRKDAKVKQAVTGAPWNISWFIAGGYSNHQRGFAMDVTLARVERAEIQTIGGHEVVRVREYKEYTMPTPIHELSPASATFTRPVASHSPTAWSSAELTDTMRGCKPALVLQRYCTEAGLTPLASEWWHFNDLETRASVLDNLSTGGYKISQCRSTAP